MFIEKPATRRSISKRKPVFGVGINDADYITGYKVDGKLVRCPYYSVWTGILYRCYSEKAKIKKPSYKDSTTSKDWLLFSNFRDWMKKQDWKSNEIDKDLLIHGNQIYSSKTCIFIPKNINLIIRTPKTGETSKFRGVSYCKQTGKYKASCRTQNGSKTLGRFDTEEEASEKYKKFKYGIIMDMAKNQKEPIRSALLNYAIN